MFSLNPASYVTLQTRRSNDPYNEIIKGLYVGNIRSSQRSWQEFDYIVNCTKDIDIFPEKLRMMYPKYIRIPVDDTPSEAKNMYNIIQFSKVLDVIHDVIQRGGKVLVHCYAGQQRSCALVSCYLITYKNMTPEQSVLYMKKRRPVAFLHGINFLSTIKDQYVTVLSKQSSKSTTSLF
jgi:protein-tyrosine phosphatase